MMITINYGYCDLRSWLEPTKDGKLRGMGQRTDYDLNGRIVKAHEPKPTGVVVTTDDSGNIAETLGLS